MPMRIGVLATTALCLAGAGAAAAQSPSPPKATPQAPAQTPAMIREIPPATVQLLGTALYAQDRQSWLAAELLQDAQVDLVPIIGWINAPYREGSRVRFLKEGAAGPFAAYDVVFEGAARPTLALATDPTLTPGELTQWRALNTALALKPHRCSDKPANHAELQLPATGEWLVWILAPWETPRALPVGGHTRVTVSPDGGRVLLQEALSRGCQTIDPGPVTTAASELAVTQQVANTPVETHVFNALQTRRSFLVTTPDGARWRVDGKSVTRLAATAAPAPRPLAATVVRPAAPAPTKAPAAAVSAPPRSGSSAARPSGSSPPTASPPVRLRGSVSSR